MPLRILTVFCVLAAFCAVAQAQGPPILGMTDVPSQPADGLTVKGVTFHFTIGGSPSSDATFNAFNGGFLTYTQDPVLEGNSLGTLTMDFAAPTTYLQFGIARSTPAALPAGVVVDLYTPAGVHIGTYSLGTRPITIFSEGLFVANQVGLIGKAVLTFPDAQSAMRFGIDNVVTYPFENWLWFFY